MSRLRRFRHLSYVNSAFFAYITVRAFFLAVSVVTFEAAVFAILFLLLERTQVGSPEDTAVKP